MVRGGWGCVMLVAVAVAFSELGRRLGKVRWVDDEGGSDGGWC